MKLFVVIFWFLKVLLPNLITKKQYFKNFLLAFNATTKHLLIYEFFVCSSIGDISWHFYCVVKAIWQKHGTLVFQH